MIAEELAVIDQRAGDYPTEETDQVDEIGSGIGLLGSLCASWEDVQRTRLALDQRAIPSDGMRKIEEQIGRQIRRELEDHPVWPWLSQFPGLGGVHTARIIALIGDPHRFPGRVCANGHHHSAVDGSAGIDAPTGCGIETMDGTVCTAQIGPVRQGTGTRSLWHYLGLHVVDGKSPRKTRGVRADWNPKGRTAVLQPGGIAEHIVRQRVPIYRDIYDQQKERLTREREAARSSESEERAGSAQAGTDTVAESETNLGSGLRPFQIDAIARKVAVKAFVADLLQAMKRVM